MYHWPFVALACFIAYIAGGVSAIGLACLYFYRKEEKAMLTSDDYVRPSPHGTVTNPGVVYKFPRCEERK